jgi:hypothetical protein
MLNEDTETDGDDARHARDAKLVEQLVEAHKTYGAWTFNYEFGIFSYERDGLSVYFTPDWTEEGKITFQVGDVYALDLHAWPDESYPVPLTAEHLWQCAKQLMDASDAVYTASDAQFSTDPGDVWRIWEVDSSGDQWLAEELLAVARLKVGDELALKDRGVTVRRLPNNPMLEKERESASNEGHASVGNTLPWEGDVRHWTPDAMAEPTVDQVLLDEETMDLLRTALIESGLPADQALPVSANLRMFFIRACSDSLMASVSAPETRRA